MKRRFESDPGYFPQFEGDQHIYSFTYISTGVVIGAFFFFFSMITYTSFFFPSGLGRRARMKRECVYRIYIYIYIYVCVYNIVQIQLIVIDRPLDVP